MSVISEICDRCGQFIEDLYYLKTTNRNWHISCLKCSTCGYYLENEQRCFYKNKQTFCEADYIRKFYSNVCARCQISIESNALIHRINEMIFHADCFACSKCNMILNPGDEFGMKDEKIFCREHFLDYYHRSEYRMVNDDSGYQTSPNERTKSFHSEYLFCDSTMIIGQSDYDENSSNSFTSNRNKRLRTSFKHHQLRYLKSYFTFNHNPDSKELKILSEKTNLPKRVLQVWFQNARAKYRRCSMLSSNDHLNLSLGETSCSNQCIDRLSQSRLCISPIS